MTTVEQMIYCWLLPALITFLIVTTMARSMGEPIREWDVQGWSISVVTSVVYPLGLMYLYSKHIGWQWLLKDRFAKK